MIKFQNIIDAVHRFNPRTDCSTLQDIFDYLMDGKKSVDLDLPPQFAVALQTALLLAEQNMELAAIGAGLLFPFLEKEPEKAPFIRERFGNPLSYFLDKLIKLSEFPYVHHAVGQPDNYRKMIILEAGDPRIVLIKIAGVTAGLENKLASNNSASHHDAIEALHIYAPLAHIFGVVSLKRRLEDSAFRILYPQDYDSLKKAIQRMWADKELFIQKFSSDLKQKFMDRGISPQIISRIKNAYSVWYKMKYKNRRLGEVYDLLAFRIIVGSVAECYEALSVIHNYWKPIKGRFKDFIANPKSNGYRSLHSTILVSRGRVVEIQIRSFKMHQIAERGLALHSHYKIASQEKYSVKDYSSDLLQSLFDIHWVYVRTPDEKIIRLPQGATPLDFAYSIHTDLGRRYSASLINGAPAAPYSILKNGDQIFVITDPNSEPDPEQLKWVKSRPARKKLKRFLRQSCRSHENRITRAF